MAAVSPRHRAAVDALELCDKARAFTAATVAALEGFAVEKLPVRDKVSSIRARVR